MIPLLRAQVSRFQSLLVLLIALALAASNARAQVVPRLFPFLRSSLVQQAPFRNPSMGLDAWDNPRGVFLHSGEFLLTRTDLTVRARAMDFRFTRTYRSANHRLGPLGHGWDANVFVRLQELSDGRVVCHDGSGRRDVYKPLGGGTYLAPRGFYTLLRKDGNGFLLRGRHGTKHSFDLSGRLQSVRDRVGNEHSYVYAGGKLVSVFDELHREVLVLGYANDRLTAITDFTGRAVNFSYDANNNLIEARSPVVVGTPHGNDFPAGKRERYTYDGTNRHPRLAHNLLRVVAPNEVEAGMPTPRLVNVYGQGTQDFDRVILQTVGGTNATGTPAGGTLGFDYTISLQGIRATRVTDRNGNVADYHHDKYGHALEVADDPGGPTPYVTRFEYNDDGEITRALLPMGNEIQSNYDSSNPDRFQQGNLLEVIRLPDAGRGGDQTFLRTVYTYEPLYNQVRTVTEARGYDPVYVPQNGGISTPGRYTTTLVFDYQEAQGQPIEALDFGIVIPGNLLNLGDVNGDGRTDQAVGNLIRRQAPTVTLLANSEQAGAEGDTDQEIVSTYTFNDFGQLVQREDARGNTDTFLYFPENDPDGDGLDLIQGNDPTTGGYLSKFTVDALLGPNRQDAAPLTQLSRCYEYDARGNVTSKTDGRGEAYIFTYNALDQVVQLELPRVHVGQSTGFLRRQVYDANDNVVALEVPNWKPDANGMPVLVAGHPFFEHATTYDILDNVLTQTQDATRDAIIPQSAESESLVTRYVYDANENVVLRRSPLAEDNTDPTNVERYVYDERDLMIAEVRGDGSNGAATVGFGYDLNGNQTSHTDAEDNDALPGPESATYVYDGFDRLVTSIDRAGNESRRTYDPGSHVIKREAIGPIDGSAPQPATLESTHFLFDELGRLIQKDRELFIPSGVMVVHPISLTEGPLTPGDGRVSERFEYDALDRLTFRVEDDGGVYGREYDGADRMIRSTWPLLDFGGVVQQDRVVTYDANDNMIREEMTLVSPEGLEPPRLLTNLYVYDALDRLVRLTDSAGSTMYKQYDSRDNMVSTTDARGALIADPLGLYTAGMINAPGNPKRYAFDGIGRLWLRLQELHQAGQGDGPIDVSNPAIPTGLIEQISQYDANGRTVSTTDGTGNTTSAQYDSLDRTMSQTNADGGALVYTYDRDDNVTVLLDENGTVHSLTYDGLDRQVRHDLTLPSTTIPSTTLPMLTGTTMRTWEYDGLSRRTRSLDNNEPGDPNDDWEVRTVYDSLSRGVEQVQNGSAVSSSFDGNERSELFYPRAGRVIQFVRDEEDQIVSVVDPTRFAVDSNFLGHAPTPVFRQCTAFNPGAVIALTSDVQHDAVMNVETSQDTALVPGVIAQQTVTRDRNHALVQQQLFLQNGGSGFMNLAFNWGLTSLQQIETHDRQQDVNGLLTPTFYEFRYGPTQEILEVTDGVFPVQTNAFDPTYERINAPFDYDAGQASGSGLRTKDGNYFYQWDGLGRLQVVSPVGNPLSPVAEYDYDAEPTVVGGRRIAKDVQNSGALDGITRFYYDEDHVIEETAVVGPSEDVSRQFIYGYRSPDDVVAMDLDTNADGNLDALFFYGRDANNNTSHLVDENGNVVEFYAYDHLSGPQIYDASMNLQGLSPSGNPYLFTGRRHDAETGLYYYRARFFDPENGEFLSRDPLGFWGDMKNDGNPMTYARNDLWNLRDASGLSASLWDYLVGAAHADEPMGAVWLTSDIPTGVESDWYGHMSIEQTPVHQPVDPWQDVHGGQAVMGLEAVSAPGGSTPGKEKHPPSPVPFPCSGEDETPAPLPKVSPPPSTPISDPTNEITGLASGGGTVNTNFTSFSFNILAEGCPAAPSGPLFGPPISDGGPPEFLMDELEPAPLGVAPPLGGVFGAALKHDDFVRF